MSILPLHIIIRASTEVSTISDPSPNWIYTYFRAPHHTALFPSLRFFLSVHTTGILYTLVGLLFTLKLINEIENPYVKRLTYFVLVSIAGTLMAVPIAFIDKEGILLKFYLYRINSLSVFCLMMVFCFWLFTSFKEKYNDTLSTLILALAIPALFNLTLKNLNEYLIFKNNIPLRNICQYIKEHTDRESVVLSFEDELSFIRRAERDRFSVYKFIPGELGKIPNWYEKVSIRRELLQDLSTLPDVLNSYRIDYLLSTSPKSSESLDLIHQEASYYLYKTKKSIYK